MWRPHGDNMETTWRQHEDNVETTSGPQGCGDHMGTTWRQHGDNMRDNLDLIEIIQFCLKIYDLLTHPHPHLWVVVWVVGWMVGLICGFNGWGHVISIKIK